MITDTQLAELKALEQAATPGPWDVELNNPDHHPSYDDAWFIPQIWDHGHGSSEDAGIYERADAAFIAAARTAMPLLIAEVERLRAGVAALNEMCGESIDANGHWVEPALRADLERSIRKLFEQGTVQS